MNGSILIVEYFLDEILHQMRVSFVLFSRKHSNSYSWAENLLHARKLQFIVFLNLCIRNFFIVIIVESQETC